MSAVTLEEQRVKARLQKVTKLKAASVVEDLVQLTSGSTVDEVVKTAMVEALVREHPTLVQSMMRTLQGAMTDLAKHERFGNDARSQASKEFAKHCAEFNKGFPYV